MWRGALSILETASRIVGDTNAEIRVWIRNMYPRKIVILLSIGNRDFNVFSNDGAQGPLHLFKACVSDPVTYEFCFNWILESFQATLNFLL